MCKNIEKTIKQTIQNTLNSLEKDTDVIVSTINQKLKKDTETRSYNLSRQLKSSFFTLLAFVVLCAVVISKIPTPTLLNYLGKEMSDQLSTNLVSISNKKF